MKCSHCRKVLQTTVVDEGRVICYEQVFPIQQYGWNLCAECCRKWVFNGRRAPVWLRHRWKILYFIAGVFLLLVAHECLAEEAQLLVSKTCYVTSGALSRPFRCDLYEYKAHRYWVGFQLDGIVFRVEEETPLGNVVIFDRPFVPEEDV